jgi:uncharacterized delta-60 repeat protein
MKTAVAAGVVLFAVAGLVGPAAAAPGDLDPGLGGDGVVVDDGTPVVDGEGLDVAVQDDGKIVVVGEGFGGYLVARYTSAGALDPTFSDNGWVKVAFPRAEWARASSVDLDATGRIVVGGRTARGIGVARLWPGGHLDGTFGAGGRALLPNTGLGRITDLVVDPQDRVVFGGWRLTGRFEPDGTEMLIGRLTTDGDLDPAFHGGRIVVLDPPQDSSLEAIGLLPDGRIVGVGSVFVRNGSLLTAVRLWPGGAREHTFGRNGIARIELGRGFETAQGLAVLPGGGLAVTGWSPDGRRLLLARLTAAGRRDTTFAGDGVVTQDLGRGDEVGVDVVVDDAGRLVVVGDMRGGGDQRAVVLRYTPTGELDPTFGGNGWTPVNPTTDVDAAEAMALTPEGDVVVAISSSDDIVLARLLAG